MYVEWQGSQEIDIKRFNNKVFIKVEVLMATDFVRQLFSFGIVLSELFYRLEIEKNKKFMSLFEII